MTKDEIDFIIRAIDGVQFSGTVGNSEDVRKLLDRAESCKEKVRKMAETPNNAM